MAQTLEAAGYREAADEAAADIVIVNSCSVRGKAEDKALGKVGLLCAGMRERPGLIVGLMGCMAQRLGRDVFKQTPRLTFSVGTRAAAMIPWILKRAEGGEKRICETGVFDDEELKNNAQEATPAAAGDTGRVPLLTAFCTILLGCDRRCAYCIVPDVRGHEHSRMPDKIAEELKELARSGAKDVTLLGQSVMRYGVAGFAWPEELKSPMGFTEPLPRLLEYVSGEVPEILRWRFTSGHPNGVTPELVRAMAEVKGVCPHLHLPMQSGSDRILALMRRGYDSAAYLESVRRLRAAVAGIALTTDVIVGFPGETEEDFEATRRMMDEAEFDNAFIFKYSPRPGTPAAAMPDDVTEDEKKRRNQVLLDDQDRRGLAINRRLIGTTTEVLAEGPSLRNPARWAGRDPRNKITVFEPGENAIPGTLVRVRITQAHEQTLLGETL